MSCLRTSSSWAPLVARLALGSIFIAHGAQKLFGVFGGSGWSKTVEFFTQSMGLPLAVAALIVLIEFLGGIAVLIGLLTRLAALGIAVIMAGAIYTVHLQNGFFMNWFMVPDKGHGYEYHMALIALAVVLMIMGGGALSADRAIAGK